MGLIAFELGLVLILVKESRINGHIDKLYKKNPDERKKLGINKSTLWYIQKNLSKGKTSKIYEKVIMKIK